jgi:hypothetical protein
MLILLTIILYFAALMGFSRLTARRNADNETFFRANRRSPWYMVAFGMVGVSISGITFAATHAQARHTDNDTLPHSAPSPAMLCQYVNTIVARHRAHTPRRAKPSA